jgi:uncharacterized membrane protein (DUF2068 family)
MKPVVKTVILFARLNSILTLNPPMLYFTYRAMADKKTNKLLPPPDKRIPVSVMIIGTFEIAVALLGLIILTLAEQFDGNSITFLVLLIVYGTMGAGLWAIQEWARLANVILHALAMPYVVYTSLFLGGPSGWQPAIQLIISLVIIITLTQPTIQHKFKTAGPKQKSR